MTLAPLLNASPAIKLHVATIVPAFVIGTWLIFFSRKGAPNHRLWGALYMALMTVSAITALFIHSLMPNGPFGGFSPIHLLVLLVLFSVAGALYYARRHNIAGHRRAMLGLYIGGLLIAGAFTFLPGRIMYSVFFG